MTPNLLVCAAIDFEDSGWIDARWRAMLDSMRPGKAGDILAQDASGVAFAARRDTHGQYDTPAVLPFDLEPDQSGTVTLLAGRLFDRSDLASRLEVQDSGCDDRLYAAAFRKWGDQCDREVVGSYAAIQWNERKGELRLARSPLQAPPLHLWRDGSRVVAASLPQTIFAAGAQAKIDPNQLANVAIRNFSDPSRSFYAGLSRVAPGSQIVIGRDCVKERKFWSVGDIPKRAAADEKQVVEEAEQLMAKAVAVCLDGANQPALSLSGGLDSSTTAVFALEQLESVQSLRSYTSVPVAEWLPRASKGLVYDESGNVKALADRFAALQPVYLNGQDRTFGQDLDHMIELGGWPTANEMNMHWVHAIHDRAGKDGCDVMLHAELGDSSISYDGLTAFPQWLARGQWGRMWRELRAHADHRPLWKRAMALSVLPWLSPRIRRKLELLRGNRVWALARWSPAREGSQIVALALVRAARQGHDVSFFAPSNSHDARQSMISGPLSEGPELDLALRLKHGISRRDPTAYRPLWEFCASLPDDIFLKDGVGRRLARLLLGSRAPKEVADQTGVGIQSADFLGRMQRDAPSMLDELRHHPRGGLACEVLDLEDIETILHACDGPDGKGEKDWLKVTSKVPRGMALARFVRHVENHNGNRSNRH